MEIRTASDVRDLVAGRERERSDLDFKARLPPKVKNRDTAKDLAAMANRGGGTIVFGVGERGGRADSLSPIPLDGQAERISAIARDCIDEALPLTDVLDIPTEADGVGVLVVRIEKDDRVPYFVDGQAWGRSGPKNVALTRNEIGRLFATGGTKFLEEFKVSTGRPAAVRARVDREQRQTSVSSKGVPRFATHYRLVLYNEGDGHAYDVNLQFLGDEGNPQLMTDDLPTPNLVAGTEVSFVLAASMATKSQCDVLLTWRDHERKEKSIEQTLTV